MVCLPCIVIPAFLFIWHKFLQPIFLRLWNPWGKVEDAPDKEKEDGPAADADGASLTEDKTPAEKGGCPIKTLNGAATATASLHSKAD